MADRTFHTVATPAFEVTFILGDGEDALSVDNVDAEITLPDDTRWSATFVTLDVIKSIMDRWRESGEHLNGKYFACPDLVIVAAPGISSMIDSIDDILASGGLQGILSAIRP